jgi:hypothetical protein
MLFFAVAVVVIGAVATRIGARRQRCALAADTERLSRAGAASRAVAPRGSQDLGDLPPPVQRYLHLALPSVTDIQEVRIRQTGTLRTDATSGRWMSFNAEQFVVPAAAGFVWNARIQVVPLVHVRVRDALIDGRGSGQVSLMSAFPVSAAAGGIEMNSGALHRYLAEAVWYPTALVPGPALRWTDIDATRALATLTRYGVSVSLEFRFAANGEVTGIYTPARWGTFPGGYRQVAWEGHFRDYRDRGGVVVPTEGEVGWYIDDEWRAVWKGVVVAYDYERDPE